MLKVRRQGYTDIHAESTKATGEQRYWLTLSVLNVAAPSVQNTSYLTDMCSGDIMALEGYPVCLVTAAAVKVKCVQVCFL